MKTSGPRDEPAALRRRTRLAMGLSVGTHALLLLAVLLIRPAPERAPLTELAWLEPGDAAAAEPPGLPAPYARLARAGMPGSEEPDQRFPRDAQAADFAPEPQSDEALADRMSTRLAALQGASGRSAAPSAGVGVPDGLLGAPAAPAGGGGGGGGSALGLHRGGGGGGGGPMLALARGGGGGGGRGLVPALPAAPRPEAAEPAGGGANARRVIAGASLIGPVADRPVLHHTLPVFPEWAKHDGVEGIVTLYFVVRADGSVRENVLVQRTAGFEDFDENARTALRAWRFEPLRGGRTGEQWGTITFQYRLRDLN